MRACPTSIRRFYFADARCLGKLSADFSEKRSGYRTSPKGFYSGVPLFFGFGELFPQFTVLCEQLRVRCAFGSGELLLQRGDFGFQLLYFSLCFLDGLFQLAALLRGLLLFCITQGTFRRAFGNRS